MNRTIGLITANYYTSGDAELTEKRPPAVLPYGGRYRLLDFALSNMVNARITKVGFVTPYYYRSIMDHMRAGKVWGLDRKSGGLFILPGSVAGFTHEEDRFMLRDFIGNSTYLERGDADYVLCTDCSYIYNADYKPLIAQHEMQGKPVTFFYKKMGVGELHRGWYLELDAEGNVTRLYRGDNGEYLLLNCFIIDRSLLLKFIRDYSAMQYADLFELLQENIGSLKMGAMAFGGYVGYTDGAVDYLKSSMDLLQAPIRRELFSGDWVIYTKTHDEPPTMYQTGSSVKNSVVSSGSVIEGSVQNSVLFREVTVAKDAEVKNCVMMENCVVHPGAKLNWVICDKEVEISEGVTLSGTPGHPCILGKGKKI